MNKNIDRSSILQTLGHLRKEPHMERLTAQRCNGIKTGYWSPAKKDDLVQRLGPYEDIGLEPAEIVKRLKDAEKAAEGRNA